MQSLRGFFGRLAMRLFSILSLQDKVVFTAFDGKNVGDNPYVIFLEMKRQHPELQYVWLIGNKRKKTIEGAKVVGYSSLQAAYHLSTSKLWIDNSRKREWIYKRKNQYYVQTWHGDISIKKIEMDAAAELGERYIKDAMHDSQMADLFLSGSEYRTKNYRTSFWYDGEILEYGTPKSEVFYTEHEQIIRKVKEELGLSLDSKLALYCPTFRSNNELNVYNIDYIRLLHSLKAKWEGDWYVMIRLHPILQHLQNKIRYSDHVINGSKYTLTNEMVIASDLVITDYSACMFAGLEAKKKVVLYAPDLVEYEQTNRGLYFSIRELPFPLSTNNDELEQIIMEFDESIFEKQTSDFRKQIGYKTAIGTTKRTVEYIYYKVWGKK